MPIRALLFDLDDTLLETHTAHQAAMHLACERAAAHHPGWTADALKDVFTRTYRALEAEMETGNLKFDSQMPFRIRTWHETLRACDLSVDLAQELAHLYLDERRKRYRLYEDVPDVLTRLMQQYTLVLVTNGLGDLQREKVRAVGLERWIRRLAISGEVGSWKPHADIFHHALELAEVPPVEALMVGDSLERDIAGAQALGICTVWIRRYEHLQPVKGITPHHTVTELAALETLISSG